MQSPPPLQAGLQTPPIDPTTFTALREEVIHRLNQDMGERVVNLERQLQQVNAVGRHKVNPAKPEKYSGMVGQADQWCFQMEQYFYICGIMDPQRVPFAGAMLTGNAAIWWRSVCQELVAPITSWDQFKNDLIHNFKHIDNIKVARNRLRQLKQLTSVARYYAEFTRALFEIPGVTDDEKMDRFYAGLKPQLQREVTLREPTSFNELVKMAHKLDQVLFLSGRWDKSNMARSFDRPSTD